MLHRRAVSHESSDSVASFEGVPRLGVCVGVAASKSGLFLAFQTIRRVTLRVVAAIRHSGCRV
jgi:hypothetical protein